MHVDFCEAGTGQSVILLHSTVSGNRQWRRLVDILKDHHRVIAPNLIGYGSTTSWSGDTLQTLKDQAEIVRQFIPNDDTKISMVGHSFGGSVAMMAAKIFARNIDKLILIEPNPNYLLRDMGRHSDFAEVSAMRDCIKINGEKNTWDVAAAIFTTYFNRDGAWEAMDDSRKELVVNALKPNFHEWDAVMNESTSIEEWEKHLPKETTVLSCKKTINSSSGIVKLFRSNMPDWSFIEYEEGGHMAPLTQPQIVNPIIKDILSG